MTTRTERDSFGPIEVPVEHLWGAQTQRSLQYFHISSERMPDEIVLALAEIKRACALVNLELGLLNQDKASAIMQAADEVLTGLCQREFPLSVWQTGSGTQSNMNVNEVLANRASELLGGERGTARKVHANDEVNLGQSSNDIFPTAMHVAAATGIRNKLLPALLHAARGTASEGRSVRRYRQDRPHPFAGCDTADAGPGILRLCGAAGPGRDDARSRR